MFCFCECVFHSTSTIETVSSLTMRSMTTENQIVWLLWWGHHQVTHSNFIGQKNSVNITVDNTLTTVWIFENSRSISNHCGILSSHVWQHPISLHSFSCHRLLLLYVICKPTNNSGCIFYSVNIPWNIRMKQRGIIGLNLVLSPDRKEVGSIYLDFMVAIITRI